jgi:DNA polymerase III alpha subunit
MFYLRSMVIIPSAPAWPRPPHALPHGWLDRPPEGARVTVAGLVTVRQRPGTANGVIFLTLEDETGVANVVVWAKTFERFRRAVIAGRLLRVTGRLERQAGVAQVIADRIEDLSALLGTLTRPLARDEVCRAADQP